MVSGAQGLATFDLNISSQIENVLVLSFIYSQIMRRSRHHFKIGDIRQYKIIVD